MFYSALASSLAGTGLPVAALTISLVDLSHFLLEHKEAKAARKRLALNQGSLSRFAYQRPPPLLPSPPPLSLASR